MGTLQGLAGRMEQRADMIDDLSASAVTWLAKRIVSELIRQTPVDTSRALSNWQVWVGRKGNSSNVDFAKGTHGSTRGASIAKAIRKAHAAIDARDRGQILYISNVVRYIVYLNDGTSRQAPAMFVETIVLKAKLELKRKIKNGDF